MSMEMKRISAPDFEWSPRKFPGILSPYELTRSDFEDDMRPTKIRRVLTTPDILGENTFKDPMSPLALPAAIIGSVASARSPPPPSLSSSTNAISPPSDIKSQPSDPSEPVSPTSTTWSPTSAVWSPIATIPSPTSIKVSRVPIGKIVIDKLEELSGLAASGSAASNSLESNASTRKQFQELAECQTKESFINKMAAILDIKSSASEHAAEKIQILAISNAISTQTCEPPSQLAKKRHISTALFINAQSNIDDTAKYLVNTSRSIDFRNPEILSYYPDLYISASDSKEIFIAHRSEVCAKSGIFRRATSSRANTESVVSYSINCSSYELNLVLNWIYRLKNHAEWLDIEIKSAGGVDWPTYVDKTLSICDIAYRFEAGGMLRDCYMLLARNISAGHPMLRRIAEHNGAKNNVDVLAAAIIARTGRVDDGYLASDIVNMIMKNAGYSMLALEHCIPWIDGKDNSQVREMAAVIVESAFRNRRVASGSEIAGLCSALKKYRHLLTVIRKHASGAALEHAIMDRIVEVSLTIAEQVGDSLNRE